MEPWGWILIYLVGFTLFQLLLFRYFTDERGFEGVSLGSGERSALQSADGNARAAESQQVPQSDTEETDREDGVSCPHCGAYNADEQFTFCRKCTGQIR